MKLTVDELAIIEAALGYWLPNQRWSEPAKVLLSMIPKGYHLLEDEPPVEVLELAETLLLGVTSELDIIEMTGEVVEWREGRWR